jgi:hypothetical protein
MKYRVGEVQSVSGDDGFFLGVGFSIVNEDGAPIVTFGYLDGGDAVKARMLVEQAIAQAKLIASPGR